MGEQDLVQLSLDKFLFSFKQAGVRRQDPRCQALTFTTSEGSPQHSLLHMCRAVSSSILHFWVVEFNLVSKTKRIPGGKGEGQTWNCIGLSTPENTVLNDLIMSCPGHTVIYANPQAVVESTASYASDLKEIVLIFCINKSAFFLPSFRLCRCLFYSQTV